MRDIALDHGAVTSAAGQVSAVAARLRDIDVAGPMEPVRGALAGSKTSQAIVWLSTNLGAAVQVYADGLDSLDEGIRRSVDGIQHTDTEVAAAARRHTV